jgi:hypothetical protein
MTSPAPGSYNTAATTVGTTPTLIAVVSSDTDGVLVQNTSTSTTIYLGGANVAATGANLGFALAGGTAPGTSVLIPSTGGAPSSLYAVTASSTATVVVLFPSGD